LHNCAQAAASTLPPFLKSARQIIPLVSVKVVPVAEFKSLSSFTSAFVTAVVAVAARSAVRLLPLSF